MQKKKIAFEFTIFETLTELSNEDQALMLKAVAARKNAYAPYSGFQVGAAVLMDNGASVIGSNQENASYPSGLCAERVAVFQAGALYPGMPIKTVAISAASINHRVGTPPSPCGICRQSISEYEIRQKTPIKLLLMGEMGPVFECGSMADLLPLGFDSSFLG